MIKEELLVAVLTSDNLPTLPPVASKLIALTSDEDTTFTDIANLVSQDIALSAKVLKVSNSAFYGFPQQIGSIHQAASILGTNALASLVMSFSFLSIGTGSSKSQFNFEEFWQRSLSAAAVSKLILEQVQGADTEQIFISGLLQNMGELIFCSTFPSDYDKVLAEINPGQGDAREVECSVFGVDHALIGYEVAKNWGFPPRLILPILYHHSPGDYKGEDEKIQLASRALYLSDILISILYSDKPEEHNKRFRSETKRLLGLKTRQIEEILSAAHSEVEQAGASFGMKFGDIKPIHEILQEANIRLSHMNLDYEQMNKQLIKAKISLEKLTEELREKNKLLDNMAHIDGLTNIFNNRYFQGAFDKELSRATRNSSQFSLVLIDIDLFKSFNDTYGHLIGDFVLVEFARVLGKNLREYDILARYGGEEFVIILPDTSEDEAIVVAEKLRLAVETTAFKDSKDTYNVTASFGLSLFDSAEEKKDSKKELIKMADVALYDAKDRGRNKVVAYRPKKKWFKSK
ncbi:MAG: GGDEF domain-containing protein [Deltaproteobacteria bacterium]|nr:MAG: GGDEF domain-containing protein [Deltaproteobacteria bacterium]